MLSVHLKDLEFHGYHGLYEGEGKIGNDFMVDLEVKYDEVSLKMNDINSIINYEVLYEIVRKRMAIPSPLLEEVAETIILKVRHKFPVIKEITFSIFKLNPPIEKFVGRVGITMHKRFED
jgi:dihydroneopterin aldolase